MKPKDPLSVVASLLLAGSVLFLGSGLTAWFLRSGNRPDGGADAGGSDRTPALSTEDSANAAASTSRDARAGATRDGTTPDGAMSVERAADQVDLLAELLIEGRVLDPSGQPVEGAAVSLELRLDARPAEPVESSPGSKPPAVRTAADGRFAFRGDAPQRADVWMNLVAHAAGHAPLLVQHVVEIGSNFVDVGDLQLLSGGSISGRITDALGHPLAQATATLQPLAGHPLQWTSERGDLLAPAPADGAGFYEFAHRMPGSYRVTATAPGMQEGSLRDAVLVEDGRDIEVAPIRLVPGLELTGVVLAVDDAAVSGAEVHLSSTASGNRFDQRVTTGADGRFRAEHLPPGPLQIEARAIGFTGAPRVEVDAATSHEVVLRLASGLGIRGVVVDARSGAPVERFAASLRAIGPSELGASSAATRLLRRKIQSLRDAAAAAADPAARARSESAALELEARLLAVDGSEAARPPRRPPAVPSPVADHPRGSFEFTGLDEGSYTVAVVSVDHRFASTAPIELRRGAPAPELRIEVERGIAVSGLVVAKEGGAPLPDATVELVAVDAATSGERGGGGRDAKGSPFSWAFATPGAHGVAILSAKSDGAGRFEMRQAPPGRYFLAARHDDAARQQTEPFDLRGDRDGWRIVLPAAASLHGRVRGVPAGLERDVTILAVGGFGTLRTVKVGADSTYRIERLQPGSYVVRALPADERVAFDRLVTAIFATEGTPAPPDLTLAEGERGEFDVTLDLPAVGAVEGSVLINGEPSPGFQVVVRSAAGVASANRVSLRTLPDSRGRFALRNVPPGDYTFQVVSTTSRQELHREPITVAAGACARIDAMVAAGGLRGHVVADRDPAPERLDGTLTILPGATAAPADVRQYGQTHRVHTVRVRGGVFEVDHLTPGAALVIVDIRGCEPTEAAIDVPVRTTLDTVFSAGRSR